MEIRVLKYFLTVAQVGNITKAADILHITQPTLSRQLMQLEEDLGVKLFDRSKKKLVLTEMGLLLKQRAEEIVALSDKTEAEIIHQNQQIMGEITIATGVTDAAQLMGKLIKQFSDLHPDVTFNISIGNGDMIVDGIDKGIIDIGFVLEPVNCDKLNYIYLSHPERYGLLLKKSDPLAKREVIRVKDLHDIKLINTGRPGTQQMFQTWAGKDYSSLKFVGTSELVDSASILVQNDIGVAIVLEGATKNGIHDSLCFRPFYPELDTRCLIAWKKYKTFNYTMTKFIDFIHNNILSN